MRSGRYVCAEGTEEWSVYGDDDLRFLLRTIVAMVASFFSFFHFFLNHREVLRPLSWGLLLFST